MGKGLFNGELYISKRRPHRRRWLGFLIRRHDTVLAFGISLLVLLSVGLTEPWLAGVSLVIYWAYHFLKALMRESGYHGTYTNEYLQLFRSIILTGTVTIFLGYLYFKTDFLDETKYRDPVWLLYLLSVFVIIQYGTTPMVLLSLALAIGSLFFVSLFAINDRSMSSILSILSKSAWLGFIVLFLHILVSYLRNWAADLELVLKVQEEILSETQKGVQPESQLLNAIAKTIATDFHYQHVNFFRLESNGNLTCVAASSIEGQRFIKDAATLEPNTRCISQHVVSSRKGYYTNDTCKDEYYLTNMHFKDTKAELAVPIQIETSMWGVLDIQSSIGGVFFPHDVELIATLANFIARVLQVNHLVRSEYQISHILQTVAKRFLSENDFHTALSDIAHAAHDEFHADLVVLYEVDNLSQRVRYGAHAGVIVKEDRFSHSLRSTQVLIEEMLKDGNEQYRFDTDLQQFDPLDTNRTNKGRDTFVFNEDIHSRATSLLYAGDMCVGVMFLNFRTPTVFDEEQRRKFLTFANLAGLAVNRTQYHRLDLVMERQEAAARLYDGVLTGAAMAEQLVHSVLTESSIKDEQRDKYLATAVEAITQIKKDVRFLHDVLAVIPSPDFQRNLEWMAKTAEQSLQIPIELIWESCGRKIPSRTADEILLILSEALYSLSQVRATRARLLCEVTISTIRVLLESQGGVAPESFVRPPTLQYMRMHAEKVHGQIEIPSEPEAKLQIIITIPFPA